MKAFVHGRAVLLLVLFALAGAWPMIAWAMKPDPHAAPTAPAHGAPAAPHGASDPHAATNGSGPAPHGDEHAGDEHGHWPPPGINWTNFSDKDRPPFAAMLVNFALLVGLYYTLGKKPIAEALLSRRAAVAKEIEEAQRMKREAEKRAEQYQEKLGNLEEELVTAKAALVEAGKGEKERIVREAEEKAARMQKDAEFLVEQEMRQMQQDLWREAVEKATATAEDLLRKRVTDADQERLAEEYLSELGRRPLAPSASGVKAGAS